MAAPDGTFAAANANARLRQHRQPVPKARIANPNQIQFTSGLTVTA